MFGIMSGLAFLLATSGSYGFTLTGGAANQQAILAPLSGIHIHVSSQDTRGSLSCAILTVSGRIQAGQLARPDNQCDFIYRPKAGLVCNDRGYACDLPVSIIVQNDDVLIHTYTVSFSKLTD